MPAFEAEELTACLSVYYTVVSSLEALGHVEGEVNKISLTSLSNERREKDLKLARRFLSPAGRSTTGAQIATRGRAWSWFHSLGMYP